MVPCDRLFSYGWDRNQRRAWESSSSEWIAWFHGVHHPLELYTRALESAGFAIEALREPRPDAWTAENPNVARWRRVPNSLHVRAVRPGPG